MNKKPAPIGKQFNMLTVISEAISPKKGTYVICKCECGKITQPLQLARLVSTKRVLKSCGCFRNNLARDRLRANKHGLKHRDSKMAAASQVYRRYYNDGLSFEEFHALSQLPCHYCGAEKQNKYKTRRVGAEYFRYNGVDRLDSSINHAPSNVVPCCGTCNWMKNDSTYTEFLNQVQRIKGYMAEDDYLYGEVGL